MPEISIVGMRLGVDSLRGYIDSKEVIKKAIRTAKNLDGVKEVKSLLVVDRSTIKPMAYQIFVWA